jgi:hypothetical protein
MASSERVAFGNFILQLERKAEVDRQVLRFYFNGKFDNYLIEKVRE